MAAEHGFLDQHLDGVVFDLDSATRLSIILDYHLGMNGMLNSWHAELDDRLIDEVRRFDNAMMRRLEVVLVEQLERAKTIVQSRRRQMERLWLQLIERGSLSGDEIEAALWLEDAIPMPTPKSRRKIRQR